MSHYLFSDYRYSVLLAIIFPSALSQWCLILALTRTLYSLRFFYFQMAAKAVKPSSVDRGYAWVVLLAGVLGNILLGGACYSSGVINVLFLDAFRDTRSKTAWISALNVSLLSAAGPLSGTFVKLVGFRWTIIIGGLLTTTGCIASTFCSNTSQLILTYGFVSGLGLGIAYTPIVTSIGYYFDKYRTMAAAVSSVGAGVGTFVFAPITQTLADMYDWKGAILLIGGIQLHLCICGALIRPLEDVTNEKKTLCEPGDDVINSLKGIEIQEKAPRARGEGNLYRNGIFYIISFSILFTTLGQFIVYIHLSAYALTVGTTPNDAAFLAAVVGITSLIGRFVFSSPATDVKIGSLLMYAGSLGVNGLLLLLTPLLMPEYWGQLVVACLFGFYGNGWIPLLTPLNVEYLGLHMLTSAFGGEMLMSGIGSLLGPPLAGWLYDTTESYEYGFYLAGILILLSSGLMMTISLVPKKSSNVEDDIPNDGKELDILVKNITEETKEQEEKAWREL